MSKRQRSTLPPTKEMAFRLAYVLYKAGGQLSLDRAVELMGEYFLLSDESLGDYDLSGNPKWTNAVQWARQFLNSGGFLEPVEVSGSGNWRLSKAGRDLGRWAEVFYENRRTDLPPWVADFLGPIRKRIRGFVRGTNSIQLSDAELCRWLDLCYRFEMWSQGAKVFRRILKDNVPEDMYQVAERQARICEHRGNESKASDAEDGARDKRRHQWGDIDIHDIL